MIKFYHSVTLVLSVICSPIFNCNTDAQKEDPICAKEEDTKTNNYNPICQYYLAPSSIPNAGFGVYTTQSIPANTPLQHQSDSPTIVVTDIKLHNGAEIKWLHADYFWAGDGYSADTTVESVLGFGALANYHPYLYSALPKIERYGDDLIPRGSGSPGIGASSLHDGWQFQSDREISAGEEVFVSYSEQWLKTRSDTFAEAVARQADYKKAAEVLKAIAKNNDDNQVNDQFLEMIKGTTSLWNKRASSLIPTTTKKYLKAMKRDDIIKNENKTMSLDDIALNLAHNTLIPRTLDWIRNEGQCLDNLIPGLSTIPDAGRGGFAQRFIPKDSMVVPAPLLQIMNRDSLFMYDLILDEKTGKMKKDTSQTSHPKPTSQQMLINYCFSHPDVDILLCPQSNAILINHCSTRKSYGGDCESKRGPNAKVRWTGDAGRKSWDPKTQDWLKMNIGNIATLTNRAKERGLSFDIIASRDILPGEEVFIDYGIDWEVAWEKHVENWIPPSVESYTPISQLNSSMPILRTPKEIETNPYPDNAQMVCMHGNQLDMGLSTGLKFEPGDGGFHFGKYFPCRVIELEVSTNNKITYKVETFSQWKENVKDTCDHLNNRIAREMCTKESLSPTRKEPRSWIQENYSRESILFIPKKYSNDEYLKGVFRHYITIKDEMVPSQWKENVEDTCDHLTSRIARELCNNVKNKYNIN